MASTKKKKTFDRNYRGVPKAMLAISDYSDSYLKILAERHPCCGEFEMLAAQRLCNERDISYDIPKYYFRYYHGETDIYVCRQYTQSKAKLHQKFIYTMRMKHNYSSTMDIPKDVEEFPNDDIMIAHCVANPGATFMTYSKNPGKYTRVSNTINNLFI